MIANQCYLDESGIHDQAKVCVVAGFFGSPGAWRKFDRPWVRALKRYDVSLEDFHANALVKRGGFFWNWTAEKSLSLQLDLAKVIASCRIYPVAQGIIVDDFFELSLNERRFLTGATLTPNGRVKESGNPNRPYFSPFQAVIRRVLSHSSSKTNFYFGLDRPFARYATGLYSTLKNNPGHPFQDKFGDISFPEAKETPALQAADFLVYLVYSHMLERVNSRNWYVNLPEVMKVLQSNLKQNDDLCFQDKACMKATLRMIPIEQRGELLIDDLAV